MEVSVRDDAQKTLELARVKSISEQEAKRTEALKATVEGIWSEIGCDLNVSHHYQS